MTEPRSSRRRVLGAGMTVGALLVTGPTAGCTITTKTPEAPDPLESPARRAASDVVLAQHMATAHPALAAAATALAADRQAHTAALRREVHRVRPSPTASSSVPPPLPATTGTDVDGARQELAQAMYGAQAEAAGLVATLPGYRAALLASIAACCASHAAMLS